MLLTSKKWHTAAVFEKKDTDAVMDALLKGRNIVTPEQREKFMLDGDGIWHDPFLFADMDKAVDIIVESIRDNKKILVYGDYDCDGVTATSILVRYFRSHDCNVSYIVPHRAEHGYGLTENIMDKVTKEAPDLLITVDCGITNIDTVKEIKDMGIKVIVTDHHNVKDDIPKADAVICAKREDNTYPFKDLCGAGVALKLIEALGRDGRFKVTGNLWRQSIELAGIATIADLVSVVDENRTIIKKAFKSMKKAVNPGVRIMNDMLLDQGKTLDETFISFNFVPRINAAGRLYDSSDALKLFLGNDEEEVRKAAEALGRENEERKQIEAGVFSEAVAQIEDVRRPDEWMLTNTCGPVVAYGKGWHQGVLGIVAGKLSQYFRRTAIVFTDDSIDPENVKGSGRAFGEYDLFGALEEVSDDCVNYGGHKKAAGLVVKKSGLKKFMTDLEENAKRKKEENKDRTGSEDGEDSDRFTDDDVIEINAQIPFEQVTFEMYERICVMKPFGIANRKPVFSTLNLIVTDMASMSDGAHIRLELSDGSDPSNKETLSAVGFGFGQYASVLKIGDRVDIAYTMNEYTYRGKTTLSLHIEDLIPEDGKSFLWAKNNIAEELYGSGMTPDQIGKLAGGGISELIPGKEQYLSCYRVVFDKCSEGISTVDIKLLSRMITANSGVAITPFQTRRCLDVFSEAGIIKLGVIDPDKVCFSFLPGKEKVNLNVSSTYKRLNEYV